MKMRPILVYLLLLGSTQAPLVRVGQSTQLNGISPTFGVFGQAQTTQGLLAFWKPEGKPVHFLPLQAASITGIDEHCIAGTFTNPNTFGISGFQQCTDRNGGVQFFEFDFGANATLIVSQIPGTEAVAGYFDDFHLKDTGFVSTPTFDSNGKVLSYKTSFYRVPNAISTNLLTANQYGIAGSFEKSDTRWEGFLQRTNSNIEIIRFPGAVNTAITAISEHCYAGTYDLGDGTRHGFFQCDGSPIPFNLGYGDTIITQITQEGTVVGYAIDAQDNNFGFILNNLLSTFH